jgi:hypothetical protein
VYRVQAKNGVLYESYTSEAERASAIYAGQPERILPYIISTFTNFYHHARKSLMLGRHASIA